MATLISGIGRSGTTTIYQILGNGLLKKHKDAKCAYEPYLWDIPEVERTAKVKGQPFNVGQVGLFNMSVHTNTPLFLSERHMLHDAWLRGVFGPVAPSAQIAPDNVMAKVIRGSGRLEAALTRFSNLKIVIITRNVVDTVNSGLGLFSFFGDEFHPSDKPRFLKEIKQKFNSHIDPASIKNEMEWAVLWWRYFMEASFQTYEKFPERVMLVPYEKYIQNKYEVMAEIFDFVGIERSYIDGTLFNEGAGPQTSVSYLNGINISQMKEELDFYCSRIKETTSFDIDVTRFYQQLIFKYTERDFSESLLLTHKTDLTAVQWRMQLKNTAANGKNLSTNDITEPPPLTLARFIAEFGCNEVPLNNLRDKNIDKFKSRTVGVLITCYNNEKSIAEAIYSVLAQSKKPDLIVVSDDCSSDDSVAIVKEIASKHQVVKFVERAENVGIAANRDLSIREMDTDYIVTLDGDDLFLPGKLELEYHALEGRLDRVAFSDIVVIGQDNTFIQNTSPYSEKDRNSILKMLVSRSTPVPRDMMFPKILFEQADGFDVAMNIYEDWAFKIRLMAKASNNGWIHSGGIGTLYDRRQPGLSGKAPIVHAYGQLLALSRNVEVLSTVPGLLEDGLITVSKHLEGKMNSNLTKLVQKKNNAEVCSRLSAFWETATFKDDDDLKFKKIFAFSSL